MTLAVDGKICTHLETGLNHDIADGKVSDTPTRADYYPAGALKEADVDYVFNNVGFSSASTLYTVPLRDDVRERAEKTLAERSAAAPEAGREWGFYVIPDLKTWATNAEQQTPIEHFATFEEAKARFDELRSQPYNSEAKDLNTDGRPYAHLTLGMESKDGMSAAEVLKNASTCDNYLLSANGLAETGEIINIDGTGNRVSSSLYGHKRVWFVVGSNKIAPTYDEALWRARNIAAPKNAQRLGVKTPCAVNADRCYDCKSPQRICRGLVVLWEAIRSCETEVVLVDEPLGY